MGESGAQSIAVVVGEGERLGGQGVPDHGHEAQAGAGAAGAARSWFTVFAVVAVLVLLVLVVPQSLHVLDWQLRGGVWRW